MCGIVGFLDKSGNRQAAVGQTLLDMLSALGRRGPDSSGVAVYADRGAGACVLRIKLGEHGPFETLADVVVEQVKSLVSVSAVDVQGPSLRVVATPPENPQSLEQAIEAVDSGVEVVSLGTRLELVKQVGSPANLEATYAVSSYVGTHGIGHTRMATESDVDIRSAHPYWAFPYNDVAVVHNGQLTNYWLMRREMERKGHRFMSDCDSELLAVYTAHNLANGVTLDESLERSIREIDGVFTYLVATRDQLGMAKDTMAAKPLVLYESDDLIALASEEVAIRAILPDEIDTYDPYDEETRVWQA